MFIGLIVICYKQVLNLSNFSWSALKLQMNPGVENSEGNGGLVEALPPIAGHSMVSIRRRSYWYSYYMPHTIPMLIHVNCHLKDCLVNFNWQVKWDKKLIMLGGNLKGSSDRILGLCSVNYITVYVTVLSLYNIS